MENVIRLLKMKIDKKYYSGYMAGVITILLGIGIALFFTYFVDYGVIFYLDSDDSTVINNYHMVSKRIGNKFILEFNDPDNCLKFSKFQGASMKPRYDEKMNSIIDVCITPSMIDIGDVIIFRDNDGIKVTHRVIIIHAEQKQFLTKGDNNFRPDGWIDFNMFIAKEVSPFDSYDFVGSEE